MYPALAAAVIGALIGLAAHDLAAQALHELRLRPLTGVCHRCGEVGEWLGCRRCGASGLRRAGVAVATAAMATGFWSAIGTNWLLVPFAGFLLLTTALVLTDLDAMRIVDRLNLPGSVLLAVVLGTVALLSGDLPALGRGLLGAAAYFAGTLLLYVVARGNGFGAGDVKLAPVLGLFTAYWGWTVLGRAAIATAFVGGLLAVGALLFTEAKRDTELAYGPAMVLGAWVAILTL